MRRFFMVLLLYCCRSHDTHALVTAATSRTTRHCSTRRTTTLCVANQETATTAAAPSTFSCRACQEKFSSRNALFRHLRSNAACGGTTSTTLAMDDGMATTQFCKQSIALQFGYFVSHNIESANDETTRQSSEQQQPCHLAELAGQILEECLTQVMTASIRGHKNDDDDDESSVPITVQSRTQSSLARLRPPALQQEPDMAAAGRDVLVLSMRIPATAAAAAASSLANQWANSWSTDDDLFNAMQTALTERQQQRQPHSGISITLEAIKFLDNDMPIHAERSCTQLGYQYLLPLEWLPGGDKLLELDNWTRSNESTESLRSLKRALRSAESARFSKDDDDSSSVDSTGTVAMERLASGRFGALAQRERRAWHNYCIQRVSPNHDVAWRVIDRCRIVGFVQNHAVIQVQGDELLQGQVRAIVGTAVAIANEWLPDDSMRKTTSKDLLVTMPLAPAGRTYLSDAKFHFEEMRTGGQSLFVSSVGGTVLGPTTNSNSEECHFDKVRKAILKRQSDPNVQELEAEWLKELETKSCPAIVAKLQTMTNRVVDDENASIEQQNLPPEYEIVLKELQSIVESGSWPETSAARQTVIKSTVGTEKERKQRGSFTIVNTLVEHPVTQKLSELPLGNARFPELVKSVFALEKHLGQHSMLRVQQNLQESCATELRPSSSHCAVNCDAQFTPHVDSGRGKGQQLSMIVGLGNYTGGGLLVEGKSYNIRYAPIEFDGWKLRHWTAPFEGQRFSLVWFTPDLD